MAFPSAAKLIAFLSFLVCGSNAVPFIEHVYHHYTELTAALTNLSESYPDYTDLYEIGQSVEGRSLWVISIAGDSPGAHKELRPEVKYIGNMHGNEVIGREVLLQFAEFLLVNYDSDDNITEFLDNTRVHIMPTMNPDGFEISEEGLCTGLVGRTNKNNVNLNRNFPDYFEPDDETREIETVAVMEWLKTEQFVLSANLHGGALLANYPYDNMDPERLAEYVNFLGDPSPYSACDDDDIFRFLSLVYSNSHTKMRQFNETQCFPEYPEFGFFDGVTNGADWYAVKGGMQDYNYIQHGCFEITLEIACCKYPFEETLPDYWDENRPALLEYLRQVHRGIKGIVRDAETNNPLRGASVKVDNRLFSHNTTNLGEYWYILLPDDYEVEVSMDGYDTQVKTVTVLPGLYNTMTLNFDLMKTSGGSKMILPSLSLLTFVILMQKLI